MRSRGLFKLLIFLVLPITYNLSPITYSYAQETLTITTYYPSPFGNYQELRAQRMAVGTTWFNPANFPWDTDGVCAANEICNADLVVEGNVGIGTTTPQAELHIRATDGITAIRLVEASPGASPAEFEIRAVQVAGQDRLDFFSQDGAITRTMMALQKGGNVGIGTMNPLLKLDARGANTKATTVGFENIIQAASSDAANPLALRFGIKTDVVAANRYGAIEVDDAGTKRNLVLQPLGGNVGIGMNTPGSRLVVQGSGVTSATSGLNVTNSAGTSTLFVRDDNRVGIGTISPSEILEIASSSDGDFDLLTANGASPSEVSVIHFKRARGNLLALVNVLNGDSLGGIDAMGRFGANFTRAAEIAFYVDGAPMLNAVPGTIDFFTRAVGDNMSWAGTSRMTILSNGIVSINDSNPLPVAFPYIMYVNGNLRVNGTVFAAVGAYPDYVFAPDYKLLSLKEVKRFIDKDRHLPGMPSGRGVEETGIDLVGQNNLFLVKLEEAYLYIIQLEQRIEKLESKAKIN